MYPTVEYLVMVKKKDLSTQRDAVEAFCLTSGRIVHEKFEDIGSGLNYNRKNFIRLMEMVEQGAFFESFIWFEKI